MQTQTVVVITVAITGEITQTEVATMRATMGAITLIIAINVANATKGHQMMPRLSVRTNQNIVIRAGRAITIQVIVTGAHPVIRTQQRLQTGWAVQKHSVIQKM